MAIVNSKHQINEHFVCVICGKSAYEINQGLWPFCVPTEGYFRRAQGIDSPTEITPADSEALGRALARRVMVN